ncbi:MAG: Nudix family hydrolase [Betaproteobacteria bacterium]|nr:Nudix family hydrolase [Betaproteobacteria bacterium]
MKVTDVAVAILQRPDGGFLLSSRPEGKPYPHYWEFPGGKIEPGETVLAAMVRELQEELAVTITRASPWFTFMMHYTHATVRLHCWRVQAWTGELRGMEGQAFQWQQSVEKIAVSPTLPGCVPIFRALSLPTTYAITNATELGEAAWLAKLDVALEQGLRLIQVREKGWPAPRLRGFAGEVMSRARAQGAKVLINGDAALARELGADGVHLTAAQLGECGARPDFEWVGASTHNRAEIERAAELKCDFAVLGPVQKTLTHPDHKPLGWEEFAELALDAPLPVFAIGGVQVTDLAEAQQHGGHGVALQRGLD